MNTANSQDSDLIDMAGFGVSMDGLVSPQATESSPFEAAIAKLRRDPVFLASETARANQERTPYLSVIHRIVFPMPLCQHLSMLAVEGQESTE
jgi:hypothetical protein